MSSRPKPGSRLFKALLPVGLLAALAAVGVAAWAVRAVVHPPRNPYLVTPQKFTWFSDRGLKVTEETWANRDGTTARGWLLRGDEGAPAVVMLHRYGADRSWLLNFGVMINEATNFTVLWPDLRGHGEDPPVQASTLGAREAEDVSAALDFLRGQKTHLGRPLVGDLFGLYGVELGAHAALVAASREPQARALVLDSVPASPDELLRAVVRAETGFDNALVSFLARAGTRAYFLGDYANADACAAASRASGVAGVLLLAGQDAPHLQASTASLARCFPASASIETRAGLPLTGFTLASAPGEQGEAYNRVAVEFFNRTLRAPR